MEERTNESPVGWDAPAKEAGGAEYTVSGNDVGSLSLSRQRQAQRTQEQPQCSSICIEFFHLKKSHLTVPGSCGNFAHKMGHV